MNPFKNLSYKDIQRDFNLTYSGAKQLARRRGWKNISNSKKALFQVPVFEYKNELDRNSLRTLDRTQNQTQNHTEDHIDELIGILKDELSQQKEEREKLNSKVLRLSEDKAVLSGELDHLKEKNQQQGKRLKVLNSYVDKPFWYRATHKPG